MNGTWGVSVLWWQTLCHWLSAEARSKTGLKGQKLEVGFNFYVVSSYMIMIMIMIMMDTWLWWGPCSGILCRPLPSRATPPSLNGQHCKDDGDGDGAQLAYTLYELCQLHENLWSHLKTCEVVNQVTVARIMMVVVKVGVDGVHCFLHCLLFFFFVEHVSNIASLIRQGPCPLCVKEPNNVY